MRLTVLLLVLAVVSLALFGAPARAAAPAADPAAKLDAAEKAYVELEYDKANKLADAVVKTRGLTHEQLVRAYRLLARTHAILDHKEEAKDAFVQLLTYEPDEKEDKALPPKVTERQLEARGVLAGYGARPGIEVSAGVHASGTSALRVTTRDPTHIVKRVVVGWRWGGTGSFTTTTVPVGDQVVVDVPSAPRGVSRLDYYAQAFDERDDVVFEAGNPVVPRTALEAVAPPPEPPAPKAPVKDQPSRGGSVFASPVFWAIAGGVVLAGGLGVFAATRSSSPSNVSLSPQITCAGGRC